MPASGREQGGGARFNPLWLLDLAAAAGALAFGWIAFAPRPLPAFLGFPLAGELALSLVGVGLIARALDTAARRRTAEAEARQALLQRLDGLDEALMDLRRSLSRDGARRFVEAREAFERALASGARRLDRRAVALARRGVELCAGLTAALSESIPHRAAVVSMAYRLGQEIGRAGRRGELDPYAAGDLRALIEDALGVMDEALYAEWNADHFGRLGAVQRHFARRIERRDGETVRQIDREAAGLFDALIGHVREKVALVETLAAWEQVRDGLGRALSGRTSPPRAAPPRPSMAARFAVSPSAGQDARGERPRLLSAAND